MLEVGQFHAVLQEGVEEGLTTEEALEAGELRTEGLEETGGVGEEAARQRVRGKRGTEGTTLQRVGNPVQKAETMLLRESETKTVHRTAGNAATTLKVCSEDATAAEVLRGEEEGQKEMEKVYLMSERGLRKKERGGQRVEGRTGKRERHTETSESRERDEISTELR